MAIRQILASTLPSLYCSNNNLSLGPPRTTIPNQQQLVTVSVSPIMSGLPSTSRVASSITQTQTMSEPLIPNVQRPNTPTKPQSSVEIDSTLMVSPPRSSANQVLDTECRFRKKLKMTTLAHLVRSLPYGIILMILGYVELPILQYVEWKELPHPFDLSKMDHSLQLRRHLSGILFGFFKTDKSRTLHLLFTSLDFSTHCHDPTHHHHVDVEELHSGSDTSGSSNSQRSGSPIPQPQQSGASSHGVYCPLQTLRFTNNLEHVMFKSRKFVSIKLSDCNLSGEEMKCFAITKQGSDTIRHSHLRCIDFSKNHKFSAEGFKQYLPTIEQMSNVLPYPNLTYLNLLETATDAYSLVHACKAFPKLQILKHSFSTEHVVDYNICVKALACHTHLQQLHLECTSGYYELNMKELLQSNTLKKVALFGFQFSDNNVSCDSFKRNTTLKKLSLTNCFIAQNREQVAASIASSTSIRELIFSEINLKNKDVQLLSERMDKLSTLIIGGSDAFHMNTSGFTKFHMLKSLQKFVIDGFSDYCTLNLETCKAFCLSSLTFLELDGFQEADDTYLALILKQGVSLKALKVKQTKISCSGSHSELATALRNHTCLKHLKLDENEAIGDAGALFINKNLPPTLTKLGLTMCNISDLGARALISNKQIRKLKIKMNNITDESLKLLKYNTTLTYVSIDALRSEEMVRIIGEENKTLKQLSVISIPLTDTTINSLIKNTSLHYLKIKNCDHLNKELKQKLTDLASFGVIFRGIFSDEAFL